MRVVVDLGSAQHGDDSSIEALVEEYAPDVLYGLDPQCEERTYDLGGTLVMERPWAAWTYHGEVGWKDGATRGQVDLNGARTWVPCVDLVEFIAGLREPGQRMSLIVKLDVEGAEYALLPHLIAARSDYLLSELRVEWHCEACGQGVGNEIHPAYCTVDGDWWRWRKRDLVALLTCPTREWNR